MNTLIHLMPFHALPYLVQIVVLHDSLAFYHFRMGEIVDNELFCNSLNQKFENHYLHTQLQIIRILRLLLLQLIVAKLLFNFLPFNDKFSDLSLF